jgi:hypothetical protein
MKWGRVNEGVNSAVQLVLALVPCCFLFPVDFTLLLDDGHLHVV